MTKHPEPCVLEAFAYRLRALGVRWSDVPRVITNLVLIMADKDINPVIIIKDRTVYYMEPNASWQKTVKVLYRHD